MSDPMLDSAQKLVDCADALRALADKMADRRMQALVAGQIDSDEFRNNVQRESFLRHQVNAILLKSISSVISGVAEEQADLIAAIRKAQLTIKKIEEIQKALTVFASVIGLAEAIALGKPQGILVAFKAVKAANAQT